MPKRPRKSIQEEWDVEDILDIKIDPKELETRFLVKWKKWDKPEDNTWETLDAVYKCPLLLRELAKKKRQTLIRPMKDRLPQDGQDAMPELKQIPNSILAKFKDPMEFIPNGNEKVEEICNERLSNDKKVLLWKVIFKGDRRPCFVRKCVVCYYWPFEASLFMTLQVSRSAKLKKFEEKIAEKKKAA